MRGAPCPSSASSTSYNFNGEKRGRKKKKRSRGGTRKREGLKVLDGGQKGRVAIKKGREGKRGEKEA